MENKGGEKREKKEKVRRALKWKAGRLSPQNRGKVIEEKARREKAAEILHLEGEIKLTFGPRNRRRETKENGKLREGEKREKKEKSGMRRSGKQDGLVPKMEGKVIEEKAGRKRAAGTEGGKQKENKEGEKGEKERKIRRALKWKARRLSPQNRGKSHRGDARREKSSRNRRRETKENKKIRERGKEGKRKKKLRRALKWNARRLQSPKSREKSSRRMPEGKRAASKTVKRKKTQRVFMLLREN
ncbi:hypothetical protein CEXT_708031 [Caerostris extrusa]|uniref:Uncharacterized protein n=1 Tax=Caerostris extrusa TaxID=172846 RepID=A0AAV4RSH0_CAEEX|nr:hypothetical protein CEXT_708031 [Caerostris extrusa]